MKKIIPYINAENELSDSVINKAIDYEQNGADGLFIYNYSMDFAEREEFLHNVKAIEKQIDIPIIIGCYINRFEDIKKALYTGAVKVVTPYNKVADKAVLKEGSNRFGTDKIFVEFDASSENNADALKLSELKNELAELGVAGILLKHLTVTEGVIQKINDVGMPVIVRDSLLRNDIETLLSIDKVEAVSTNFYQKKSIYKIKLGLKASGIPVETWDSTATFDQLKKNSDGMVPVIVQDYKNNEVLMLAYMNEEAYNKTIETGRMHYYSRSRQKLWLKGEESGHFQYVKCLSIDCDNDTILAKVMQIGAACHTGNRTCFYRDLVRKEYTETNNSEILDEVYKTIMDRKQNPKEGSYTNYLFDKGIDKILKKCGEEATEIVIAAKNPDPEELKYEISDFLYHMMVLMAERGLDWDDITQELAHRH